MDSNDPSHADDQDQLLSIALKNEIDALIATRNASQAFSNPAAASSMLSMGVSSTGNDVTSIDYLAPAYASQTSGIPVYSIPDATEGFSSYESASLLPSKLDDETDYRGDGDEIEYEESEIKVYEDGTFAPIAQPNRKVKRYPPMTAQQQAAKIQQLQEALHLYHDPDSANSQNIPASVQEPTDTCGIAIASSVRVDSPTSHLNTTSPPPKKGAKRGSHSQGSDATTPRSKKSTKTKRERRRVPSEALKLFAVLNELGKPFEEKLEAVVEIVRADSERRGCEHDATVPVKELVKLVAEWKVDHAAKFQQMTAFLERWGLIPIGGMEGVPAA